MTTPQITLFTTCKPFSGLNAVFQKNAIRSWAKLGYPIILIGDEPGVEGLAQELGLLHIPNVARNEDRLPRVDALFEIAQQKTNSPYIAYLNSDIILLPDFHRLVDILLGMAGTDILAVARRQTIALFEELNLSDGSYTEQLEKYTGPNASWDPPFAIDLFACSRDLYDHIPPFSIGRPLWDNWMLHGAEEKSATILDASGQCTLLHPAHGYGGNWREVTFGESAQRNRKLGNFVNCNIETSSSHYIDGTQISPTNAEQKQAFRKKFSASDGIELMAMLQYFKASGRHGITTTPDDVKALLWRLGYYFPLSDRFSATGALWRALLEDCYEAVNRLPAKEVAFQLQNTVCREMISTLQKGANNEVPILVWGTGQFSARLTAYLARHQLAVTAFIDQNAAHSMGPHEGTPLLAPHEVNARFDKTPPLIIVGTMYTDSVLETIRSEKIICRECIY